MQPSELLRSYLEKHLRGGVTAHEGCTCGRGDHARVLIFRVDGEVIAAVVPESRALSPAEFGEALGATCVERMEALEPTAAAPKPSAPSLESLFSAAVYVDESLAGQTQIVFCPRMFLGQQGRCFQVPAREFLELTKARILTLTSAGTAPSDDWAV